MRLTQGAWGCTVQSVVRTHMCLQAPDRFQHSAPCSMKFYNVLDMCILRCMQHACKRTDLPKRGPPPGNGCNREKFPGPHWCIPHNVMQRLEVHAQLSDDQPARLSHQWGQLLSWPVKVDAFCEVNEPAGVEDGLLRLALRHALQ